MNSRFKVLALAAISLALFSAGPQAAKRDIPTYDRDSAETTDRFVRRLGPDVDPKLFRTGELGVLLPTFDRASLFLAYRALRLGREELGRQAAAAKSPRREAEPEDGLKVWLAARRTVSEQAPKVAPGDYRDFGGERFGGFLNCTPGAFILAAQTLQSVAGNPKFARTDAQDWLAAQDAVFALCTVIPDGSQTYPLPLDARSPLPLRQLRDYQIATALFYAGRYDEALGRFDAIAVDRKHPMRAWAAQAAMRSILRKASLDDSFPRQLGEIKRSGQADEQRRAAAQEVWKKNEMRLEAARGQIVARVKAIQADATLSSIHPPAEKLKKQASTMLTPALVYGDLSQELGRFDRDVELTGELEEWTRLGDRLFDLGWRTDFIETLRRQHEYFDWIRTIQGCTDNPASPNYSGRCEQENSHARQRWEATRSNAWLLATLATARRYGPELESVAAAARQFAPEAMEYPSARYHLARLLRVAGRGDEARALLVGVKVDALMSSSARNLFAQERLALARDENEALPNLLRLYYDPSPRVERKTPPVFGLGADGDELINRRLSAEDMLRLAGKPAAPGELRKQLLVAAWWRADMTDNQTLAQTAARSVADAVPTLRDTSSRYLQAGSADKKHLILAAAALQFRISPQVGKISSREFATPRRAPSADWWCSFASADFVDELRIQRVTAELPRLTANPAATSGELNGLNRLGISADWLARLALEQARVAPQSTRLRPMLQAVIASTSMGCVGAESDRLVADAKRTLAALPPLAPIPESQLRAEYDRMVAALGTREYRVSHILVRSEAEAKAALAAIQAGSPFEEQARQKSIDSGSRPKGGDLGWALPSVYVEPFAAALRSAWQAGQLADPVKTPFGWHVIRIDGIRAVVPTPFEKARAGIEERLRQQQD